MLKEDNANPFFIVGSGRSGSTLLRLILASHSRITIPPETWFIIPLIEKVPATSVLTNSEIEKSVEIITNHYRWPDMGIDEQDFRLWVTRLNEPRLKDILNLIYDYHLKLEEKSIWGDKTPPYIKIVPELLLLYPNAKFIHIIRDGRDVAKSFQSKGWNGKWLFRNVTEWKEAINIYNFLKLSKINSRVHEVKYEDLVLDTQSTVKKICSFLDVSFEPSMLDWTKQAHNKIPGRELHIHEKIFQKPNKSDVNRFHNELSKTQILIVESYINKELKSVGYKLKFNESHWIPVFYIIRIHCNIFYLFYSSCKKVYGYFRHLFCKNLVQ